MEMAQIRGLSVLLVCLAIFTSSSVSSEDVSAETDHLALIQTLEEPVVLNLGSAIPGNSGTQNHEVLAAAAKKAPPAPSVSKDQAEVDADRKAAGEDKTTQAAPQQAAPQPQAAAQHGESWHCAHCGQSCSTDKCKQWCEKQHCKQNAPLFMDTAVKVPVNSGDQWKCAHCSSVCKTQKCKTWCGKFWCSNDAGPQKVLPSPKVMTGTNRLPLLVLSATNGKQKVSPGLIQMERKANAQITASNTDVTGKLIRKAMKAIDGVEKQRQAEATAFKQSEVLSNKLDAMRYPKAKYAKWAAAQQAIRENLAQQVVTKAKNGEGKDQANEVKYKSRTNVGNAATKDMDTQLVKDETKFAVKEAVAEIKKAATATTTVATAAAPKSKVASMESKAKMQQKEYKKSP